MATNTTNLTPRTDPATPEEMTTMRDARITDQFAVGDRVWVMADGTDGGDAGWATLVALHDNGMTCDLRDDNGAEWHTLIAYLIGFDPGTDSPMPEQTQQSARSVIVNAIWHTDDAIPLGRAMTLADAVLIALTDAGYAIVNENDLTTLVSELIYQQGKRNQSESIGDATGIVRRLKDRAALAPKGADHVE